MSIVEATAPAGNVRPSHLLRSDKIDLIAVALAAASLEFLPIEKKRTARVKTKAGDVYEYKYADLSDVLASVKPGLSKHGMVIVQSAATIAEGAAVVVTTVLLHTSGQWFESSLIMPVPDGKPQTLGSVITYARRYSLTAMLGIMAEEDDDAGVAQDAANDQRGGGQRGGGQQQGGQQRGGGQQQQQRSGGQQRGGQQQQQQGGQQRDKPKHDWVFEGTDEQENFVAAALRKWNFDEQYWDEVRRRMKGKNIQALYQTAKETKDAAKGA